MYRPIIAGLSLFLLSLSLPIACATFWDTWYEWHCARHQRCVHLGDAAQVNALVQELQNLMWHNLPLGPEWSAKERQHLIEVRALLLQALYVCTGALVALLLALWGPKWRQTLWRAAKISLYSFIGLSLILPFFGYFWRHIFHALLFDNQLWLTNRQDVLWYLTPRSFFFYTFIAVWLFGLLLNGLLYRFTQYSPQPQTHE